MYTRNFQCRLLANQSNAMWLFYYNLYALLKRQQTIAVIFKSSFLAAFKVDYSCLAVGRGLKNDFFRWMKLSNRLMTDIEMTIRALTSVLIPLLLSKFTKYMQIFSRQIMKTLLTWKYIGVSAPSEWGLISNLNKYIKSFLIPWNNAFWPGLTPFGPLLW